MALQGDLQSFALPDVLRLLAGTGKSGHLQVTGAEGTGELVLAGGTIASASITSAPNAEGPADVVFELLRLTDGSFTFDERDGAPDGGGGADVDETIGAAESLLAEWTEVETVVPSMAAWVTLVPELEDESTKLGRDRWRMVAAIGSGGSVRDLADGLSLTDLAACRGVKDLADAGLVAVRATHGYAPATVELDSFEAYEEPLDEPMTDLEDLVVEDRPVVMEDRDDALLPEPLPGEGVAYEGELVTGAVDGHAFDSFEPVGPEAVTVPDAGAGAGDVAPFSPTAPGGESAFETFADGGPPADPGAVAAPALEPEPAPEPEAEAELTAAPEPEPEVTAAPTGEAEPEPAVEDPDDERGSLLRFLSTVKN